jgi:hypothetical protein
VGRRDSHFCDPRRRGKIPIHYGAKFSAAESPVKDAKTNRDQQRKNHADRQMIQSHTQRKWYCAGKKLIRRPKQYAHGLINVTQNNVIIQLFHATSPISLGAAAPR